MTATIEVLRKTVPSLAWFPVEGPETSALQRRKRAEGEMSDQELERAMHEAQVILGRSVDPAGHPPPKVNTGLIVGYVQSGKTMSFTAVTALARDNGFGLVILLAGTQLNLKDQSEDRLSQDLGLDDESLARAWRHFSNPTQTSLDAIRKALSLWRDTSAPTHVRRAVLITVLKNTTHLNRLAGILQGLDLHDVPALVIDDEADQASLNTLARRGRASPTYLSILGIRSQVPWHTFLQYTATPHANLLITINDRLSPDFCELVTPGADYVGGKEYFRVGTNFVQTIPVNDQQTSLNGGGTPPATLLQALRLFVLGLAYESQKGAATRRSMMIHPSQPTRPHGHFAKWVNRALNSWRQYVDSEQGRRLLLDDFKDAHKALGETVSDLPRLPELIDQFRYLLDSIKVDEINRSGREDADFDWKKSDYWVLVGGQKLDRGFTVKGLTVTYMPRPLGSGHADSLQQRARFYGYKKSYLPLCRVYLPPDVREALQEYVVGEEDMRKELEAFRGRPLKDWYRQFFMPRGLTPTRSNILSLSHSRLRLLPDRWIKPEKLYEGEPIQEGNIDLLSYVRREWAQGFEAIDAKVHDRYRDQRANSPPNILIEPIPLSRVYEDFFLSFRVANQREQEQKTALMKVLAHRLSDNPDELASVFFIADLTPGVRSVNGFELHQGYVPKGAAPARRTYVGDAQLFEPTRFSLQLRVVDAKFDDGHTVRTAWYAAHIPQPWGEVHVVLREKEGNQ